MVSYVQSMRRAFVQCGVGAVHFTACFGVPEHLGADAYSKGTTGTWGAGTRFVLWLIKGREYWLRTMYGIWGGPLAKSRWAVASGLFMVGCCAWDGLDRMGRLCVGLERGLLRINCWDDGAGPIST